VRGEGYLLAACAIWGLTFPLMKIALQYVDPYLFLFYRFGVATAALLPFAVQRVRRDMVMPGVITGIFLFLGYFFQIVGLRYTLSTNSGLITSLYVVFGPLFSYVLFREKVRGAEYVALGVAFTGVALLSLPGGDVRVGDLITLLCAVSYGVQVALIYRYSRNIDPVGLAFLQIAVVFAFTLAAPFVSSPPLPSTPLITAILYTSLCGTAFALVLQVKGQRALSTPGASTVFTSEAFFAMLFSYAVLGETLSPIGYAGAALILISIVTASAFGRS